MHIFIRSLRLYILGICVSYYKKIFDKTVDRYIENNRPLSSRKLTVLSNKCTKLYEKFSYEESSLMSEMSVKKSGIFE